MLAIVGQIPTDAMGRGWGVLHEMVDQTAVLEQVTKHTESIAEPTHAVAQIQRAIDALMSGRPRPVSVEIPSDLWSAKAPGELHIPQVLTPTLDDAAIDRAAALLSDARRPLIVVGGGAQAASVEVTKLAHRLDSPVTTRRMGHGVLATADV